MIPYPLAETLEVICFNSLMLERRKLRLRYVEGLVPRAAQSKGLLCNATATCTRIPAPAPCSKRGNRSPEGGAQVRNPSEASTPGAPLAGPGATCTRTCGAGPARGVPVSGAGRSAGGDKALARTPKRMWKLGPGSRPASSPQALYFAPQPAADPVLTPGHLRGSHSFALCRPAAETPEALGSHGNHRGLFAPARTRSAFWEM